ncbi:MAG: hypothetical protein WCX33_01930, partial [Candidatus Shapirobacteria bacterium]
MANVATADKIDPIEKLTSQKTDSIEKTVEILKEIDNSGGNWQDIRETVLGDRIKQFGGNLQFMNIGSAIDHLERMKKPSEKIIDITEKKETDLNTFDKNYDESKEKIKKEKKEENKVKVKNEIDKLSQKITDDLKGDENLKKEIAEELENIVKQEQIKSDKDEVADLVKKISKAKGVEKTTEIEVKAKEAQIEINKWQEKNIEQVREYRKDVFKEELEKETRKQNPNITEAQMVLVKKEADLISDIYYVDGGIENQKDAALKFNKEESIGRLNNAWTEIQGITGILKKTPKEFQQLQENYKQIKNGLDGVKLPFEKFSNLRSFEGIMNSLQNPTTNNLFGSIQNKMVWIDRIDGITGGFLKRTAVEWGGKFAVKIGNQVASEFVQNSMSILAKEGFQQGFNTLLKGLLSGGVKAGAQAAGTAAAGAGATAGVTAVGAATGPPGWIIAAAVLAAGALKKIVNKISEKLGTNLGIKEFFQDNFGKVVGGILGFLVTGITMVLAIPALIVTAITAVIATVFLPVTIIVVTVFTVVQLFSGLISSLNPSSETDNTDIGSTSLVDGNSKTPTFIINLAGIKKEINYTYNSDGSLNLGFIDPLPPTKTFKRSDLIKTAKAIIGLPYFFA